jgi:hypothetical protein
MNTTPHTLVPRERPLREGSSLPVRRSTRPSESAGHNDVQVALPASLEDVQTHHAHGALPGSRMSEEESESDRSSARDIFRRGLHDVEALAVFTQRAAATFTTRPPRSFERLSDLLDELLPDDHDSEARIARALEMEPTILQRLRAGRLDPLGAPRNGLAALWQALRIERDLFHRLVTADHARFAGQPVRGLATRGAYESAEDAWMSLTRAFDRLELDDPSLVTDAEED